MRDAISFINTFYYVAYNKMCVFPVLIENMK